MPDTLEHSKESQTIRTPSRTRRLLRDGLINEVAQRVTRLMIPAHNYLTIEEFFLDFSTKLRKIKIKGMQLPNIEITAIREKVDKTGFIRISDRQDIKVPEGDIEAISKIKKGDILHGASGSIYVSYESYIIAITGIPVFEEKYTREVSVVQKVISIVQDQIPDVIQNIQQISSDSLTGLLNQRGIDDGISRLKNPGKDHVTIVLFLDGDGFKKINDTFGHKFGNSIIRQMGQYIRNTFPRATDIVGRNGGDEFVVIFNLNTKDRKALKKINENLDQLRKGITYYNSNDGVYTEHTCTVGVGYCHWGTGPKNDDWKLRLNIRETRGHSTVEEALGAADKDMYVRKAEKKKLLK